MSKKAQPGIFVKITIVVFVLVTLVISCITFLCADSFSGILVEKERTISELTTVKLEQYFNSKYRFVSDQLDLMYTSQHIVEILSKCESDHSQYHQYSNVKFIMDYLNTISRSTDVLDVLLIPLDNTYAYTKTARRIGTVLPSFDYQSLSYVDRFMDSPRNMSIFYDPQPSYVVGENYPVLSFIGKLYRLRSSSKGEPIALFIVNVEVSSVESIYEQISTSEGIIYTIRNADNDVIFSNKNEYIGAQYDLLGFDPSETFINRKLGQTGIQVSYHNIEKAALPIIRRTIRQIIPIFAIGTVLILIFIFLFYRVYRRQIAAITRRMLKIDGIIPSERIAVRTHDEIGQLAQAFNQMCDMLNNYINLNYKAELERQAAELNALQAQVNPHFLFNIIECIRMQAIIEGDKKTPEMLMQLGNMMRWSTQFNETVVSLEDELEYVTNYLSLQAVRWKGLLDYDFDIPEILMDCGILKFTLQPVIENSIQHSAMFERGLKISIRAAYTENTITFTISNNGVGIDAPSLERLRDHISGRHEYPDFGIGLRNIHARYKMIFGEGYGLHINSTPSSGMSVTVLLPRLDRKELEEYVSNAYRR